MLMESMLAGVLIGALSGCILSFLPFALVVVASAIALVSVLFINGASAGAILTATAALLCSFQFGYVAGLVGRAALARPQRRPLGGEPGVGRSHDLRPSDIPVPSKVDPSATAL